MATSLPQILTILAGDTSKPLADNLLATALGENNLGSIHENFWRSYEGNSLSNDCSEWLPIEVEILLHQKVKSGETRLHVSSKVLSKLGHTHWNIFDGVNELMSQPLPASNHSTNDAEEYTFETYKYSLTAVVSEIGNGGNANSPFMEKSNEIIHDQWRGVVTDDAHLVLHMKRPGNSEAEQKNGCWYFYNDFLVEKCSEVDVVSFPTWRKPCFLQFAQLSYSSAANHRNMSKQDQNMFEEIAVKEISSTDRLFVPIPSTVLSLESISKIPGVSLTKLPDSQLPNAGDLMYVC